MFKYDNERKNDTNKHRSDLAIKASCEPSSELHFKESCNVPHHGNPDQNIGMTCAEKVIKQSGQTGRNGDVEKTGENNIKKQTIQDVGGKVVNSWNNTPKQDSQQYKEYWKMEENAIQHVRSIEFPCEEPARKRCALSVSPLKEVVMNVNTITDEQNKLDTQTGNQEIQDCHHLQVICRDDDLGHSSNLIKDERMVCNKQEETHSFAVQGYSSISKDKEQAESSDSHCAKGLYGDIIKKKEVPPAIDTQLLEMDTGSEIMANACGMQANNMLDSEVCEVLEAMMNRIPDVLPRQLTSFDEMNLYAKPDSQLVTEASHMADLKEGSQEAFGIKKVLQSSSSKLIKGLTQEQFQPFPPKMVAEIDPQVEVPIDICNSLESESDIVPTLIPDAERLPTFRAEELQNNNEDNDRIQHPKMSTSNSKCSTEKMSLTEVQENAVVDSQTASNLMKKKSVAIDKLISDSVGEKEKVMEKVGMLSNNTSASENASTEKSLNVIKAVINGSVGSGDEIHPDSSSNDLATNSTIISPSGDNTEPAIEVIPSPIFRKTVTTTSSDLQSIQVTQDWNVLSFQKTSQSESFAGVVDELHGELGADYVDKRPGEMEDWPPHNTEIDNGLKQVGITSDANQVKESYTAVGFPQPNPTSLSPSDRNVIGDALTAEAVSQTVLVHCSVNTQTISEKNSTSTESSRHVNKLQDTKSVNSYSQTLQTFSTSAVRCVNVFCQTTLCGPSVDIASQTEHISVVNTATGTDMATITDSASQTDVFGLTSTVSPQERKGIEGEHIDMELSLVNTGINTDMTAVEDVATQTAVIGLTPTASPHLATEKKVAGIKGEGNDMVKASVNDVIKTDTLAIRDGAAHANVIELAPTAIPHSVKEKKGDGIGGELVDVDLGTKPDIPVSSEVLRIENVAISMRANEEQGTEPIDKACCQCNCHYLKCEAKEVGVRRSQRNRKTRSQFPQSNCDLV